MESNNGDYFDQVLKKLTSQDFELLIYLQSNLIVKPIFAKNKEEIMTATEFSKAILRKIITRLESLLFIESVSLGRETAYFITQYGLKACSTLQEEILNNQK